jgi:hypothetical protein
VSAGASAYDEALAAKRLAEEIATLAAAVEGNPLGEMALQSVLEAALAATRGERSRRVLRRTLQAQN